MKYTRRSRRSIRKPRRKMRRMLRLRKGLTDSKVYKFKRTCQLAPYVITDGIWQKSTAGNIITNNNVNVMWQGAFTFTLSDLPNYGEFISMFSQYRIAGVKLRFIPYQGTENGSSTGTFTSPIAYTVDKNDILSSSATVFNDLLEEQDCKLRNSQKPWSIYIPYPSFHGPAEQLTLVAGRNGYLSTERAGNAFVEHNGLRYSYQSQVPPSNANGYQVFATYYVHCKAPR